MGDLLSLAATGITAMSLLLAAVAAILALLLLAGYAAPKP